MSVVANLSRKDVRSSGLILGLAPEEGAVADEVVDSLNSTEEPVVPCRTNLAAVWICSKG